MSPYTLRIRPDKIASACLPFGFGPTLNVRPEPEAREGCAVVCRVLSSRSSYGELELGTGRLAKLQPGDIIAGVLGSRAALRGFSGRPPASIAPKSELHLLNVGGVIGLSEGQMVGLGEPIRLEALGAPLRDGKPADLMDFALPFAEQPPVSPRLVAVAGTCMNSGKTTAAAGLISRLKRRGLKVNAGKSTGVAAIRDPLTFRDHGAALSLSFLDCGFPSTAYRKDVPDMTSLLLDHLSADQPDVIVLELGDGLMGAYGVDELLADPRFQQRTTSVVLAGNDVIGAWAAANELERQGYQVAAITGPATDNLAGVARLEGLGRPSANVHREPEKLWSLIESSLGVEA